MTLLLAACATLPPVIPESAGCRATFLGLDQAVDAAGARNAGAYAIDGFPYLRSNRFLASFAGEAPDGPQFGAWVERLRRLDLESRASELRNLDWDDPGEELAHLDRCGRAWAERDLDDPARRAALRRRAAVPDDYSLLKRVIGLYPLVVPFLNMGIGSFNEDVQQDYATPYALLASAGPLVLWSPAAPRGRIPAGVTPGRDALDIPVLSAQQWQALAAAHAPHWLVETASDADRLGAPVLRDGGPALDPSRPKTYFIPAYTRFGGQVLVQLVYVAWFAERPREGRVDFYGGTLDGIIWRVTLDADGTPLLYDTVHACGCYHYYFTVEPALRAGGAKPLERRGQGSFFQEPVLFPQQAPAEPFAIRVQAGTHYIRRLVPLSEVSASQVATYEQAGYDELLSLPDGEGSRSLFGEDGIVFGTERLERTWLWPAGVNSAGAMRQWGRHATSFVGRTHFDDPGMMDRLFMGR